MGFLRPHGAEPVSAEASLAGFGTATAWVIRQAFEAFGRSNPTEAGEVWAAVERRDVALRVTTDVGGHRPGRVTVEVVGEDGVAKLIASMVVAVPPLN
jgi:hypothetical protein